MARVYHSAHIRSYSVNNYFKQVFLEIHNVTIQSVFLNLVTYYEYVATDLDLDLIIFGWAQAKYVYILVLYGNFLLSEAKNLIRRPWLIMLKILPIMLLSSAC